MSNTSKRRLRATGAAISSAALAGLLALAPTPASALVCSDLPSALQGDPLATAGFDVVETKKLYRVQARPWARIPTGAQLTVRAPAGTTEADLHRALRCGAGANSPLAVEGAALRVVRAGDLYHVQVTADLRSAANEIQRRAAAL